jgi:hypothetical protein
MAVATAASKALPPSSRMRMPAIEASGSSEVTTAWRPLIRGRSRSWALTGVVGQTIDTTNIARRARNTIFAPSTLDEKLNNFRSPAIRSVKNSVVCRLSGNPEVRLPVKIRNRTPKKYFTVKFTVKTICLETIDGER